MSKKSLIVIAVACLPFAALAQEQDSYLCTNGDLQRRLEIVHDAGVTVPCEVHYHKDTEAPGEVQVLWQAKGEEGYCEAQAAAFIEQLTQWGWSCAPGGSEATVPVENDTPDAAEDDPGAAEES